MAKYRSQFAEAQLKQELTQFTWRANFPMDSPNPLTWLFYITQIAEIFDVDDEFVTIGFSLEKLNLISKEQADSLKDIAYEFTAPRSGRGEPALIQWAIDDNWFNSLAYIWTSFDQFWSLRGLMKRHPRLHERQKYL